MLARCAVTACRILCALALIGVGLAYAKGRADNEARHVAAALVQAQADAAATAKLAAAEEANRKLARALEDQAYAETASAACGLPRARVLRLNDR